MSLAQEIIRFFGLKPRPPSDDEEAQNIYSLPLNGLYKTESEKIKVLRFGNTNEEMDQKNILVVGATGTGKTQAVNALINYLMDVKFEDNFRLEIVDLEESERNNLKNQADSQTEWITVYQIGTFGKSKHKYQINIVDTPGICDTDGEQTDLDIFNQIKSLFQKKLKQVHAVCITMNGTMPRLTAEQKYIFNAVTKMFAKDIENNIFIWATFTREQQPPVLAAVKRFEFKYEEHFTFENGPLFKKIPTSEVNRHIMKIEFNAIYETFDKFFMKMEILEEQSLSGSTKVLEERSSINTRQSEMKDQLQEAVNILKRFRSYEKIVQESQTRVMNKQNTTFYVKLLITGSKDKVLNCTNCKITCCDSCNHSFFQKGFQKCVQIGFQKYCNVCKCHSRYHDHSTFQKYIFGKKSLFEIEQIEKTDKNSLILDAEKRSSIDESRVFLRDLQFKEGKKESELRRIKSLAGAQEVKIFQILKELHQSIETIKEIALNKESTTVQKVLSDIQESDHSSKIDPDAKKLYERLQNHVIDWKL